jgi:uncharacterized membrane protein YqhA
MPFVRSGPIARILFFSRWLQLPLYLGLIVAQAVYVWYFRVELTDLVEAAPGSENALDLIVRHVTPAGAEMLMPPPATIVMLVVPGLIDVVMISNLLKTFINASGYHSKVLIAQAGIRITFLLSALAAVDRVMLQQRGHAGRPAAANLDQDPH